MNALIFMTFESIFGFGGTMSLNGSLADGSQTQQDDIFAPIKERKKGLRLVKNRTQVLRRPLVNARMVVSHIYQRARKESRKTGA